MLKVQKDVFASISSIMSQNGNIVKFTYICETTFWTHYLFNYTWYIDTIIYDTIWPTLSFSFLFTSIKHYISNLIKSNYSWRILLTGEGVITYKDSYQYYDAGRIFLSLGSILFYLRILHMFTLDAALGPTILMITKMMGDFRVCGFMRMFNKLWFLAGIPSFGRCFTLWLWPSDIMAIMPTIISHHYSYHRFPIDPHISQSPLPITFPLTSPLNFQLTCTRIFTLIFTLIITLIITLIPHLPFPFTALLESSYLLLISLPILIPGISSSC